MDKTENNRAPLQATAVEAPAERGPMVYGRAQLAALALVEGGIVASIPPQVFACVRQAGEGGGIVALVGPETDISSVQDAVLFSQAYALRRALRDLVDGVTPDRIEAAKAVLDAADPQFLAVEGVKTAEQKLAEATAGMDPSLTPSTAGIVNDPDGAVARAEAAAGLTDVNNAASPLSVLKH